MAIVVFRLAVLSCCAWPSLQQDNFWQRRHSANTWRQSHPLVTLPDDTVLMIGGCTNSTSCPQNQVWETRNRGASWTPHGGAVPWASRNFHSAVLAQSSVILLGGFGDVAKNEHFNDVWALSTTNSSAWTLKTSSAGWSERRKFGAVALPNGVILVMGGFASLQSQNDIWRSSDLGATWTQVLAAAPWSKRYSFALVVLSDSTIVLMGGTAQGDMNDVWASTTAGASWTVQTSNAQWAKRSGHQAVTLSDDSILLMGGTSLVTGQFKDVWRGFNSGTMWTPVTTGVASTWPGGSFFYVTVTTGNFLVLVEGSDSQDVTVWTNTEYFLLPTSTASNFLSTSTSPSTSTSSSTSTISPATIAITTSATNGVTIAAVMEVPVMSNETRTVGSLSVRQEEEDWEDKDYSIVIGILVAVVGVAILGSIGGLVMWKAGLFGDNAKVAAKPEFSSVFGAPEQYK